MLFVYIAALLSQIMSTFNTLESGNALARFAGFFSHCSKTDLKYISNISIETIECLLLFVYIQSKNKMLCFFQNKETFDWYCNLNYNRPIQNFLHMMCNNTCMHEITKIMFFFLFCFFFFVKSGHYINFNTIADVILL